MKLVLFATLVFFSTVAFAKPEYAVKQNVSCVTCHVSPWGGGPRTLYGKVYGSRDYGIGRYSGQELFSGNLRGISYYPTGNSTGSSGTALMEASASANMAAIEGDAKHSEIRAVAGYNAAPLGPGVQQFYGRVKITSENKSPTFIIAGRFNSPFGLLTDEHRTYTRLQTNMTWNNYVTGGAISGEIVPRLSYDFAVVNDFQTEGLLTSNDTTFGIIGNLRWQPDAMPFFVGASQNYEYCVVQPQPYATSAYGAFSFYRLTNGNVPLALLFEGVVARNWDGSTINPSIGMFFIPQSDAVYQSALGTSQSLGAYSMLRYDLNLHWSLIYKFDSLTLDTRYMGDNFLRNGFGFEYAFDSNAYVDVRYEKSDVTRPELAASNALAAQDDIWAMVRLWL